MGVRQERAAQTRTALMDSASRLFAERGYVNTKIGDIAAGASRATGSFYEHFAGKDELLQALLEDMNAEMDLEIGVGQGADGHDLSDRAQLREHVEVAWRTFRRHLPVMIALAQSRIVADPGSGRAWHDLLTETEPLREHLARLGSTGHRLAGDPTLLAAAIGGMISGLAYAILPADDSIAPFDDNTVVETMTNLLAHGLTADGPRAS